MRGGVRPGAVPLATVVQPFRLGFGRLRLAVQPAQSVSSHPYQFTWRH